MIVSNQLSAPKTIFSSLLLVVSFLFLFKVDANLLLDPELIRKELQAFAKDALGVEEMQVRQTRIVCLTHQHSDFDGYGQFCRKVHAKRRILLCSVLQKIKIKLAFEFQIQGFCVYLHE